MILWLNPVAGLSGDMLLGALLDLGAPVDAVRAAVASSGIAGWQLEVAEVSRQGMRAVRAEVRVDDAVESRPAAELIALAARVQPAAVRDLAIAALTSLAAAEGRIHDRPPAEVHLHELGGVDTIVDVVGVAAAVAALGITDVCSAPIALGTGTVRSAHGPLPVPAPATLALLDGMTVVNGTIAGETVTPTGAALVRALGCRFGPFPAMTIAASGYGAGARDPDGLANVLPAVLGRPVRPGASVTTLALLESTIDDVTGEILAATMQRLLDRGALDAWLVPVIGKKGRAASVLTVLCEPSAVDRLREVLVTETGTLGVRLSLVERSAEPRQLVEVSVGGHRIRIKVGPHQAKPEHDDVVAASVALDRPMRTVAEQARRAYEHTQDAGA